MLSVLHPVGYGVYVPYFEKSRWFSIFCACIMIPAFAYIMAVAGNLVEGQLRKFVEGEYQWQQGLSGLQLHTRIGTERATLFVAATTNLAWYCVGGAYYGATEGWEFVADGLYFMFVTSTTIGLGDIYPEKTRHEFASYAIITIGESDSQRQNIQKVTG
jgi:hypothetical protein